MRIDGSAYHVEHQSERCALAGQHGAKLLAVALAPSGRIQSQQPLHALASLLWPVRATAIMESSRARKARSPREVSR